MPDNHEVVTGGSGRYEHLIFSNTVQPLSAIAHHADTAGVTRLVPRGFPMHVAIHEVTDAERTSGYIVPHRHQHDEINLILGAAGALEYDVLLGGEHYRVRSPASIWIPAGLEHATNVVRGHGQFVCVIMAPTSDVYPGTNPAA